MTKDGSVLEEKTSFKMLGFAFSSKLDWGSYIVSIAKTASKKIGALICSMKFLSPEVALYLCISIGAHSYYLDLLDKLQKRICRTVGPSLATSFIVITLVDVHLNWLNWFHFVFLEGGLLVIMIDCMAEFCREI